MKSLIVSCLLLSGAFSAVGESVLIDELAPYAKGVKDDYWDTSAYAETEVGRATSAAFNPLGAAAATAENGTFYDFGVFSFRLSNLLDVCTAPVGTVLLVR